MPDAGEPSAPLLVDVRQAAGQTFDPMRSGVATFDFDILDVEEEQDGAPRRRDSRGRVARRLHRARAGDAAGPRPHEPERRRPIPEDQSLAAPATR